MLQAPRRMTNRFLFFFLFLLLLLLFSFLSAHFVSSLSIRKLLVQNHVKGSPTWGPQGPNSVKIDYPGNEFYHSTPSLFRTGSYHAVVKMGYKTQTMVNAFLHLSL